MTNTNYADIDENGALYAEVDPATGTAEVTSIYVYPGERGNGVGGNLLTRFVGFCIGQGVHLITAAFMPSPDADPQRALKFYEKHGFVNTQGNSLEKRL